MRTGALLLLALLPACRLSGLQRPDEETWLGSRGFEALGSDLVWAVLEVEMTRRGYEMDPQECDRSTGDFESRWMTHLNPFRFEGRRTRLIGRIEPVEEHPGWYRVRALVWVQRNADLLEPMNPAKAIWQEDVPDEAATEVFLYAMESHFQAAPGR